MGDFKVLHFKSSNADIYDDTKLTFFLKQPIILEEQYLLKTTNLSFTKREAEYQTFIDINDIEIDFSSNSGFITGNSIQSGSVGFWQFKIPNTDISILIEVFDPLFSALSARIIQVFWNGGHNDASVIFESSVIEIQNADVYRASNNDYGWYKTVASGPLKIIINSVQTILVETEIPFIKIYMDNLKFNTSSYISSCRNFSPIFDNITMDYKVLNSSYYGLVLEPQIISSITFIIEDIDKKSFKFNGVNINILNWAIMLKKKYNV